MATPADMNNWLANYIPGWANQALAAEQAAEQSRAIADWKRSTGNLSPFDRDKAQQLDDEAAVLRLRVQLARDEGVVLCDLSDPRWTAGEYRDLVAAAATLKRLRHVQRDSAGNLQPLPYQPGTRPAGTGA
jgi:hypothetical protein